MAEAVKAENSTGNSIRLIILGSKMFTVRFIRAGRRRRRRRRIT